MRRSPVPTAVILLLLGAGAGALAAEEKPAPGPAVGMQAVNEAKPPAGKRRGLDPLVLKASVLLDRAGFSPGVVDGRAGENYGKALKAFQAAQDLKASGRLDDETWAKLAGTSAEPVLVEYAVSAEDAKGPFLEKLPPRMEEMRDLKRLAYTGPRELLAEKFHMSEDLLGALNPEADFGRAGTKIVVANVEAAKGREDRKEKAVRVEVSKGSRTLRAFAEDGRLLAYYPASVGSRTKPAPTGTFQVRAIAENPTYTYNPEYGFRGVRAKEKFDIAPGPNNPVGLVWIDLSAETYGIHGTPEPERVGKSYSHGCVRLTNWDAKELAGLVSRRTSVEIKP